MNDWTQYPLPLPHKERLSAEDFFVTPSNQDAAAWINSWPEWSSHCLILYGPHGSGKTHLKEVWCEKSLAVTLDVDQIDGFLKQAAHPRAVVIERADLVQTSADLQECLFHLFNKAKEEKISLLLTAPLPPTQWNLTLNDLRSRLLASPAVEIHAPDDALLAAMMIKQFQDRQIQIDTGVIDYLLSRVDRHPASIRSLVEMLDKHSLATGRRITIAFARSMMEKELLP